jgi:DNA-binding MarR family transcriptional regulator
VTDSSDDILKVLREMRDLLVPISACFEEQFAEIQRQQLGTKLEELEALLTTDERRNVFPLLFDPSHLSQTAIAKEAGTTQPTVSRFVKLLLDRDLIDESEDETGTQGLYVDKFNLVRLMEGANEPS